MTEESEVANVSNPSSSAPRVAISGAGGLIGSALARDVAAAGGSVVELVRRSPRAAHEVEWQPSQGLVGDLAPLEGVDALVHLAGENIASGRWTARRKQRLRESRVGATRRLVESLGSLNEPPKAFVCASAVGFYGDRGAEALDETSDRGSGFLADLCVDWESEAEAAAQVCERVVVSRFGVVLSVPGGALDRLVPLFKLGLGGRLGSGRQYMSWIELGDAVRALRHLIDQPSCDGVYNLVAEPVSNADFTVALAKAVRRPAIFPVPGFAMRLALGEMAEEMLLASQRALPERLLEAGFVSRFPELEGALTHLLS